MEVGHGQADDVEVTAPDLLNESGGVALNRIGSGLPQGLGGGHVFLDVSIGKRRKADGGLDEAGMPELPVPDADARQHLMGAAAQLPQHLPPPPPAIPAFP